LGFELGTNRVLVTGASGWLGRALVEALTRGLPDVEELSRPDPALRVRVLVPEGQSVDDAGWPVDRVEAVRGDVRRPDDCARFCDGARGAILFHAAGVIHPRRVREFFEVNVTGTENVLDAAIAAGVRRAVVVSSNSPCGCNPHVDHLFDEESPYHPYMNYGRSKMLMERAVADRQRRGDIETVIVRPPWFYGPHQPPRQSLFFTMIRDGKMPVVGSGENRRSMVYTGNLSHGLLLAAGAERANGQTYWIADERPYSMNEIIATVERLLESEFGHPCAHRRLRLPRFVGDLATTADATIQAIGLYHQKIHVLSEMNKTIACSIARAREELGYVPRIALEEGMRRSLRWCIEHGHLAPDGEPPSRREGRGAAHAGRMP
jgi:nucleoside-diphosphate-sugar epimerase